MSGEIGKKTMLIVRRHKVLFIQETADRNACTHTRTRNRTQRAHQLV
jgi:hypothetical protein